MENLMSRTFKDKKEEKVKRLNKQPEFKRSYRAAIENGFADDIDFDTCPDCGATTSFESGFLSCGECNWGSFFPNEKDSDGDLEFSDVA
jgi:hypothetical protein